MLKELRVRNLGIISDIDWQLDSGLNVITGETGAGKSLIIDAVEVLLNGSIQEDVIRSGCDEAQVEGIFELYPAERFASLKQFLAEKDLEYEDGLLAINCQVKRGRPSQVRINGQIVTRTVLRQIGRYLVDIHGQSQHLSLLDDKKHLDFLDAFGKISPERSVFTSLITDLNNLRHELRSLLDNREAALKQQEFLKYQIDEIQKAGLQEGEDEELEKERHLIAHAEKLREYASQVDRILNPSGGQEWNNPVLTSLHQAMQAFKKLVDLDSSLSAGYENLEKAFYTIEECSRDLQAYLENLNFDPVRLEEIENRLELLHNLKRKFGTGIAGIIAYQAKAAGELADLNQSQDKQFELERKLKETSVKAGKLGLQISAQRSQAAAGLSAAVKRELQELEMADMDFQIQISQRTADEGLPGENGQSWAYTETGLDTVEFMVSTNPGEPLKPLAKIASTGELSRFTLALKEALAAEDNIPVLIFDEIDIGIGGRSGDIIGKKLWELAQHHQVICVTHLPQIAAFADAHYFVKKQTDGDRMLSSLQHLDDSARLKEIALMLSGNGYSDNTLNSAAELLSKAAGWKKPATKAARNSIQLKF